MMGCVTIVKINAITVPEDSATSWAGASPRRAGAVDDQDGFEVRAPPAHRRPHHVARDDPMAR